MPPYFRIPRFLALCAALVPCLPPALAADAPPLQCNQSTACELQIYIENDSFGNGTDRYYTNGIKFGGGVNADRVIERLLQTPARSALERITDHLGEVYVGLFLGQNLYTPQRITVARPQPLDRPWAAWLYVGGVAQSVVENRLQTVELDLGMIGPAALDRKSTRLNSSHIPLSRMPSSA